MGRPNLELTWVAKLRQWRKRKTINGKRRDFYLGTGKGRDDIASYRKALARWRETEDRLAAESEEQQLAEHIQDLQQMRRLSNGLDHRASVTDELDDLSPGQSCRSRGAADRAVEMKTAKSQALGGQADDKARSAPEIPRVGLRGVQA